VILFCVATDIDHAAVGILASAMQVMEVRGLIERDHNTSRYMLTDTGHAVFRVLLKRAHLST
jgi:predicted transcriptional regulator